MSGRQWSAYTALLASRFHVVAPDLLGYGDGERWPTGTPASLDDEAKALAALLPVGGAHVLGHSSVARWRSSWRCAGPSA